MSEKKAPKKTKVESEEITEINSVDLPREVLQLFVGVNFMDRGRADETRIEAGIIELGLLPPRFENWLIETKRAQIRLR